MSATTWRLADPATWDRSHELRHYHNASSHADAEAFRKRQRMRIEAAKQAEAQARVTPITKRRAGK